MPEFESTRDQDILIGYTELEGQAGRLGQESAALSTKDLGSSFQPEVLSGRSTACTESSRTLNPLEFPVKAVTS